MTVFRLETLPPFWYNVGNHILQNHQKTLW
jgi:hypothetical protein